VPDSAVIVGVNDLTTWAIVVLMTSAAAAAAAAAAGVWTPPGAGRFHVNHCMGMFRYWKALSPAWQGLIRRDPGGRLADRGSVWGVPHKWSLTVIAYRADVFRDKGLKGITDWHDLLQPKLARKVCPAMSHCLISGCLSFDVISHEPAQVMTDEGSVCVTAQNAHPAALLPPFG
jgi:hypothetical protein